MPAADRNLQWIKPPQQVRSQETLDRLLDAAAELGAAKGFANTTVAELARHAGSSVGAFYARFSDKDGLLNAVYDRYLEEATATADVSLDPDRWEGASVPEIMSNVVRFIVSIYRDKGELIRAFVVRGHTDPSFRARQERLSDHIHAKMAALFVERADELDVRDPERATAFAVTLIAATIESSVLFGELRTGALTFPDEELSVELTRACLRYLGVQTP